MDVGAILHPGRYAIVVIIAFTICAVATANLRRGTSGRRLVAVRSNERAASSLGINVVQAKVFAFALSSFVAAIGGCMLAFRYPSIGFADGAYSPLFSINMVMYAVVGGVGWVAGAVYGGLLQPGSLGARMLDLFGPNLKTYLPLAGGVLLLLTVASAPDGLAKQGMDHVSALFGRLRLRRSKPRDELLTDSDDHEVTQQSLTIENISVAFGGVQAVKSASLSVSPGEIVGLIGPNGAGKTTFIDAATGFVRASSGRVVLGDLDISRFSPVRRARVGLTRSFQSLELFDDLTVLDNLRAASDRRGLLAYLTDLIYPRVAPMTLAMRAAIREFELQEHLAKTPTELPYGVRRQVAIARAIASEASVVALDEPAAGLDNHEARELSALIRRLATNWGMGFLLVEHNVDVIMSVCDRVYVLNFGGIIAEGTPQEIRGNPAVISAYLGDEKSEIENVASSAMPLSLEPPSRAGGPARD
jgi:sulfate-transporting ATPase